MNSIAKLLIACACSLTLNQIAFSQTTSETKAAIANTSLSTCIQNAAAFHKVNDTVLEAILHVESMMNPQAINKNSNSTTDFGIAGINSVHLGELSKYGIAHTDLMNPCIGTYVGAWHLSKMYRKYGNTWFAVGAYHSLTPEKNMIYQKLIYKEVQRILFYRTENYATIQ